MTTRRPVFYIDVSHDGLNKYRRISGYDKVLVREKARRQAALWDEQWERKQAAEARRQAREEAAHEREAKKALADERTEEARKSIASIECLLLHALDTEGAVSWDTLKRSEHFAVARPRDPEAIQILRKPEPSDREFRSRLSLIDRLLPKRRERKVQRAAARYQERLQQWASEARRIEAANERARQSYRESCAQWESDRRAFEEEQRAYNQRVEEHRASYFARSPEAVEDYCEVVLSRSVYPESFPSEFRLEYRPEAEMLLVDYQLPAPDVLPRLREVKYAHSHDGFSESFLSGVAFGQLYDNCLYQITLRTVRELFQSDQIGAIGAVLFNGWVRSVDKATGNESNKCILSLQANREEFRGINLAQVDPKACFRSLKGVGSSKLHGLTPVRPILELNKDDSRFINAREVAEGLSEGDNLAEMDWEDFEHLIREIFEEEFAQGGGEVKITQASRDRGVDAVAFDPDPIRGGKIVIQAKRYTNTVGVSAVRDLFGTVMNEGAMKGILVSTSDYGPDAYEFAKDKPLTLLNGANLLHMLERHGHKARIDLREARALLKEQARSEG